MAKKPDERVRLRRTKVRGQPYDRFEIDLGYDESGKRQRRSFSTYEAAEAELKKQDTLQQRVGRAAKRLSDDQLKDASKALDQLAGATSLCEAADFWIRHNRPAGGTVTCQALLDLYIEKARKAGRRPATLAELVTGTRRFVDAFGATAVSHVTTADMEKWHETLNGGPVTINKHRRLIVALFNLAIQKGFVEVNPAVRLTVATEPKRLPYVMPVKDVKKILKWAVANTPGMVPHYAIALFAGIRPSGELQRLDWRNIDFDRREIYLSPEVSKTHDERFVPMQDNLLAWLIPHRKTTGTVFYSRRQFRQMQDKAGIRYEADCFRHSFGSYHLVHFENRHMTADAMGHRSLGMIFKHYRRAVRTEDAAAFWKILPETKSNVIALKAG